MVKYQGPSAAVIIDMWQDVVPSVLDSLLNFVQQDYIKCIVVVSYAESSIHETRANTIEYPIWHNSRQIFNPNLNPAVPHYTGSAWLAQEHAQRNGPKLNQFVLHHMPVTNQAVLNLRLAHDQQIFAAWTPDQLAYLLNSQYPDIENIYLCGGAFELCLQDRPLGLTALSNTMNLGQFVNIKNLLIPTKCVYTQTGKPLNDCPSLITPDWFYDPDCHLIHVHGKAVRESTISNDVLDALKLAQDRPSTVANQQAALAWARLETQKRRGIL